MNPPLFPSQMEMDTWMYPSELDIERRRRRGKKVEKKDSVILPEIPIGDGINLSKAKKEKKRKAPSGPALQ